MTGPAPRRPLVVLIVEDDVGCRKLLTAVLEEEGATVLATGTGREAIALARAHAFDVVFTDLGLPDVDGHRVIGEIVATARGRPRVVVVTGAREAAVIDALSAGAEAVLAKPFDWDAVTEYLAPPRASA